MSDESSSSEEGPITQRKRKTLNSGMERMGATLIKKRIPWPHEGVYTANGKPANYGDLTLMAFTRGYLMVLDMEMDNMIKALMSHHLEDLMEDSDLYGWDQGTSISCCLAQSDRAGQKLLG